MNLVSVMREVGPVRNVWEGGGMGEGILRYIKPLLIGLTSNWPSNLLARFLQVKAIGFIRWRREQPEKQNLEVPLGSDDVSVTDASTVDTSDSNDAGEVPTSPISTPMTRVGRDKQCVTYESYAAVARASHNHVPMSIVILSGGVIGCALKLKASKEKGLVQLTRDVEKEAIGASGMWYHHWSLVPLDFESDDSITFLPQALSLEYGLMLPMLCKSGLPCRGEANVFTVITSNWKELDLFGNLVHPRTPLPGLSTSDNPL
jgi:hypothetical protein